MKTLIALWVSLLSIVGASNAFAGPVTLMKGLLKDTAGGKPVERVKLKVIEVGATPSPNGNTNPCNTRSSVPKGELICVLSPGKLYVFEFRNESGTEVIGYASFTTPNASQYVELEPVFTLDTLSKTRAAAELASFDLGSLKKKEELDRLSAMIASLKTGDDYKAPITVQYPNGLSEQEVSDLRSIVNQNFGASKKVQLEAVAGASAADSKKIHIKVDAK